MDTPWLSQLQRLVELLDGTSVAELELKDGDLRLAFKRGSPAANTNQSAPSVDEPEGVVYVTAPLLGSFFRAATPGAKPFVEAGDQVEKGQVIGLIEAMKIFNEIQAEVSGRVSAILVEDGAFVEADQRLIAVEPADSEEPGA